MRLQKQTIAVNTFCLLGICCTVWLPWTWTSVGPSGEISMFVALTDPKLWPTYLGGLVSVLFLMRHRKADARHLLLIATFTTGVVMSALTVASFSVVMLRILNYAVEHDTELHRVVLPSAAEPSRVGRDAPGARGKE